MAVDDNKDNIDVHLPDVECFLRDDHFRILHISNLVGHCPSDNSLHEALKLTNSNYTFQTLQDLSVLPADLMDPYDVILLSVWRQIDEQKLGNLLADAVDKGKNAVLIMFSASAGHQHAKGRFLTDRYNATTRVPCQAIDACLGTVHQPQHPIMDKVKVITIQSDKRRSMGAIADGEEKNVDRIADWSDGNVLVAVRHNKPGLVTEITCSFGDGRGAASDGLQLLNNALRLSRDPAIISVPKRLLQVLANSNFKILQRIERQFTAEEMQTLQENSDFQDWSKTQTEIVAEIERTLSKVFGKISKQIQDGTQQQIQKLETQKNRVVQKINVRKQEDQEMGIPTDIIQDTENRMNKYVQRLEATTERWNQLKNGTEQLISAALKK